MRWCVFAGLLAGCGRIAFDPIDEGGGGGGDSDASATVCPAVPSCPDFTLAIGGGNANLTMPVLRDHGLSTAACSSGHNNPELAVQFRPVLDGTYTVTVTPAVTAVYIQDSCCGGPELMCGQNPVTLPRTAGQSFVVVVEGLPSTQVTIAVEN